MPIIITVKSGCPLCNGDVKGSPKYKFFCKKCNILYESHHIPKSEVRFTWRQEKEAIMQAFNYKKTLRYVYGSKGKFHKLSCEKAQELKSRTYSEHKPKDLDACECV